MKFHAAALREGGSNNGEPGPRPDYGPDYYGAFVYDLDGNKIEATLHPQPPKMKTQAAKKPAKKAAQKAGEEAAAEERREESAGQEEGQAQGSRGVERTSSAAAGR